MEIISSQLFSWRKQGTLTTLVLPIYESKWDAFAGAEGDRAPITCRPEKKEKYGEALMGPRIFRKNPATLRCLRRHLLFRKGGSGTSSWST